MRRHGKLSLKEFAKTRNMILFNHAMGGLGDVFIQRMMFRTVKKIIPDSEIHVSLLPQYIPALADHPKIEKIISSVEFDPSNYFISFDTSVVLANRYEDKYGFDCPYNRADIWAKHNGFDLDEHEMDFCLDPQKIENCRKELNVISDKCGPIVLFCPISKMKTKTLLPEQMKWVVKYCSDKKLIGINDKSIPYLKDLGIPCIYEKSIVDWMHYVAACDYMISVDSAAFHLAGGLKKPLLGIFTFANGKTYGKYYNCVLIQKHKDNGDWDCGPCYSFKSCPKTKKEIKPCLLELTENQFKEGIEKLFDKKSYCSKVALPLLLETEI